LNSFGFSAVFFHALKVRSSVSQVTSLERCVDTGDEYHI